MARQPIDQDYLRAFHQRHPGITEAVLDRARLQDTTAYQWLARSAPTRGTVLDLACGSAPMHAALSPDVDYLGIDRSPAELAAAQRGATGRIVRADAAALPVPDAAVDAVVCSMALMILQPLAQVLDEIHRVLRPGGLLLATVPTEPPRLVRSAATALVPVFTGKPVWRNPNTEVLRDPHGLLAAHGFALLNDEQRSFAYRVRSRSDAQLLLDSLYLPELTDSARRRVLRLLRVLAMTHVNVPIGIRRLRIRAA